MGFPFIFWGSYAATSSSFYRGLHLFLPLPELFPLDLPVRGFGQLLEELDFTGIFMLAQLRPDEGLDLLYQSFRRGNSPP